MGSEMCIRDSYIILFIFINFELLHVLIIDNKIDSELISDLSGPNNGLDDVIDDIAIRDKSETHAHDYVWSLIGIVRCYISIADLADSVDSPVN